MKVGCKWVFITRTCFHDGYNKEHTVNRMSSFFPKRWPVSYVILNEYYLGTHRWNRPEIYTNTRNIENHINLIIWALFWFISVVVWLLCWNSKLQYIFLAFCQFIQGHWKDWLSETAVWPTLFLLNVSTALKGTHNHIFIYQHKEHTEPYESRREKTGFLHMRKQRRRSASR